LKTKGTRKNIKFNNNVFNYKHNAINYNVRDPFNLEFNNAITLENVDKIFAVNRDPTKKHIEKNIDFLTRPSTRL
jgi:hypothetical protein